MKLKNIMIQTLKNQQDFCKDNRLEYVTPDIYRDFEKHYQFYTRLGFSENQSANMAYQKCEKK